MMYVLDIDSTISNNDHRAHFLTPAPDGKIHQHQWDAFLDPELVALDAPIPGALAFVEWLQSTKQPYMFLTGRNASLLDVTVSWLVQHHFVPEDDFKLLHIQMRPVGDHCLASTYKERHAKEMYDLYGPNQLMFFDDDTHVLPMFSKYGLAMKAPECWDIIVHETPAEAELAWKR